MRGKSIMNLEILQQFVRILIERVYDANAQLGEGERPLLNVRTEALSRLEKAVKDAQYLIDMPLFTDSQRALLKFDDGDDEVVQLLPVREREIGTGSGQWVGGSVFGLTSLPLVHLSSVLLNDSLWWITWVLWCKHNHTLFLRRTGAVYPYHYHLCVVMRRSMMM